MQNLYAAIYEVVRCIPCGRVATYGQIAAMVGNPRLARVVGNALHCNPDPPRIPCHRIVNCCGRLAPHFAFGGPEEQRRRLEAEGITFRENLVDMKRHLWRPGEQQDGGEEGK